MSHVFQRIPSRKLYNVASAQGMYVIDDRGRQFLDASSGGVVVSALGHGNKEVSEAIEQQLNAVSYFHAGTFTNQPMEDLADHLATNSPQGLTRVFFVSGGSEAIETAVLLARQHAVEVGQSKRKRIVATLNSFHGATLHSLAIGHSVSRRAPFADMAPDVVHISGCSPYRDKLEKETDEEYGARLAALLEDSILNEPPDTVLAFVTETIGGNTSGAVAPPTGYLKKVRDVCTKYGVMLICDEVLCGLGRTGDLHACDAEGIAPDLLVLGKGLGAGYAPIAAVLTTETIYDSIRLGSGIFRGGFTYAGHAVGCAAALKVQQIIERDKLVNNVKVMGAKLRQALVARFGNNPYVGDIRGRGLLQAIELVSDRASKEPFEPSRNISGQIRDAAMDRGLLLVTAGGTVDGYKGDHVLVAPPFIVTSNELVDIVDRLSDSLDHVLGR